MKLWRAWFLLFTPLATAAAAAVRTTQPATLGERQLAEVFAGETAALAARCLTEVRTAADWERLQPRYRRQLFEMLSLDPLPPRGDLKAVVTGTVERDEFAVEKVHFQSSPGLYVTANLYRPKAPAGPLPTVLYVCGHGPVISNGVSYGNKVAYQHHGAWFARQGYICLVMDTLQLGEIQGLHHGTHREGLWWWNSRGYTPAGVEAWNCIRALDYLQSRPDVDANRIGATGRSGGGAYSWWIAALDDRIRVVAPVAGITDLQNHVVDGTVEGHCDCMFTVNTYRWDYAQVAALVAPRPLLIVNTDADTIFPLDGVVRTHRHVRRIYDLLNAPQQLGLVIGPGPHKDTQDLQVPVFRWFNRHLKGSDPLIEMAAVKFFQPHELKVFSRLPADALNTNIHDTFVPVAGAPATPARRESWPAQRDAWRSALMEKVFAGWPQAELPLGMTTRFSVARDGVRFEARDFLSQERLPLRLYLARPEGLAKPEGVVLEVLGPGQGKGAPGALSFPAWLAIWGSGFGEELREEFESSGSTGPGAESVAPDAAAFDAARRSLSGGSRLLAWVAPRGAGLTVWSADVRKQTQLRRRFMLLGQTLDTMRAWDVRRAVRALREVPGVETAPVTLRAQGDMACAALHAALFETALARLELRQLPESYRAGPDYLNVLRVLDLPQTLTLALERCPVKLVEARPEPWRYAAGMAKELNWGADRLVIETQQ